MFTPSIINGLRNLDDFDVIHIHDARSFQGICTYLWDKIKQVPYVFQPHGSFLLQTPEPCNLRTLKLFLDKLVSSKIVKNASKIIALSDFEAEQYKRMGVPEEKIATIPNGIDLSEYAELPPKGLFKKKFKIGDDRKIILYLGRIHTIKGIDILIRAYAHLKNKVKCKDAVLVIAGPDDGYLSEAKSLVDSLKLNGKVLFTGLLSEIDKIRAYVDSDIVVNVEPLNVYGLVPLEAAACSTPVIVSKTNAISEVVVAGGFGYSVKYGSITSLASMLYRVLIDEKLAENLGKNGRRYVLDNLGWDKIVEKYEKVYEELAATKGRF
jgi:glycosyltransferase involved in cell wall biosynthesis